VEALKPEDDARGLRQEAWPKHDPVQSICLGSQAGIKTSKRPELDRNETVESDTAGGAYDAAVRDVEMDEVVVGDLVSGDPTATYAATERRPQPEGIKASKLEQDS
jgi:hypothetical protein